MNNNDDDYDDALKDTDLLILYSIGISIAVVVTEFCIRFLLDNIVPIYNSMPVIDFFSNIYNVIKDYREHLLYILGIPSFFAFNGNIIERMNKTVYIILLQQSFILSILITIKITFYLYN